MSKRYIDASNDNLDSKKLKYYSSNKSQQYLALDCETSGLDCNKHNLLSIYCRIMNENFECIDEIELNIKYTDYTVNMKALEINNIDLLVHHRTAKDLNVSKKLFRYFLDKNYNKTRYILIGHNIKFDIDFITDTLLTNEEYFKYFNFANIDTMILAQNLKLCNKIDQNVQLNLKSLCDYYKINIENEKFHTAKFDTLMCIELLKKMNMLIN